MYYYDIHICGKCGRTKDGYDYSVDGLVAEAESFVRRGRYSEAITKYERVLRILEQKRGCYGCKNTIKQLIDRCELESRR